ncbi:unnamed protein product [Cuscuta campestris]|uniref:Uncharacterized protein n=1 Tax=Cuscuta campestris TaxID=132261 RepID=A0A484K6D5_9ASTE|nr:unnamed protein product [Cuscuta campestris]
MNGEVTGVFSLRYLEPLLCPLFTASPFHFFTDYRGGIVSYCQVEVESFSNVRIHKCFSRALLGYCWHYVTTLDKGAIRDDED